MQFLSAFFRKNLKRPEAIVTLSDEIEHVTAYLQIEKARFQESLQIDIQIPEHLATARLPAFSLQPMVENAIKHGTSQLLGIGKITIRAHQEDHLIVIEISDNAGLYHSQGASHQLGLGMRLVDKRIKLRYGDLYGVLVECQPDNYTKIKICLPLEKNMDNAA